MIDYKQIGEQSFPPWCGEEHPILDALIGANAKVATLIQQQLSYIKLQTRIKTATDVNLDNISIDFFGEGFLPRYRNEGDDSYRNRILAFLLLEKSTPKGLKAGIKALTGIEPVLFEANITGDYYNNNFYYNHSFYGSTTAAYNFWITVFRKVNTSSAYRSFYNGDFYYNANSYYAPRIDEQVQLTNEDIFKMVNFFKPQGTVAHVTIIDLN